MLTEIEKTRLNRSFGVIYMVINRMNGMFYIGKTILKGKKFEDYYGSGKYIKRAKKKYKKEGKRPEEVFCKHILAECSNKKELNEVEIKFIADWDAVKRDDSYNFDKGGDGDWDIVNKHPDRKAIVKKSHEKAKENFPNNEWVEKMLETRLLNDPEKLMYMKGAKTTKERYPNNEHCQKANRTKRERYPDNEPSKKGAITRVLNDPEHLSAKRGAKNKKLNDPENKWTKKMIKTRKANDPEGLGQQKIAMNFYKKSLVNVISSLELNKEWKYPEMWDEDLCNLIKHLYLEQCITFREIGLQLHKNNTQVKALIISEALLKNISINQLTKNLSLTFEEYCERIKK